MPLEMGKQKCYSQIRQYAAKAPSHAATSRGVGGARAVRASAPLTVKWCAINRRAEWTAFHPSNDRSTWPSLRSFQHAHAHTCTRTRTSLAVHSSLSPRCDATILALGWVPTGPERPAAAHGHFEARVRNPGQQLIFMNIKSISGCQEIDILEVVLVVVQGLDLYWCSAKYFATQCIWEQGRCAPTQT